MKSTHTPLLRSLCAAAFAGGLLLAPPVRAGDPPIPYPMSSGNYFEDFADIANWANNFAQGIGADPWGSVPVNTDGAIPDGVRITAATATFTTGTSGGVQRGSATGNPPGTIVLLTTGATDNTSALAIDLHLDFTDRAAGTLSFDWQVVFNSTGDRASSLRVYASPNGTTWTELSGATLLNKPNNVADSGSVTAVQLPASLNGSPLARIRFYVNNGTGGTTGSRPKFAIDNVAVTSTAAVIPASIVQQPTGSGTYWAPSTVILSATAQGTAPITYRWRKDGANLNNTGPYSGVDTPALTISGGTAANSGAYQLNVENATGSDLSQAVDLTFASPLPVITSQPASVTLLQGGGASFTVAANTPALNAPALGYQWRSNGVALADGGQVSGATTATLTISGLTPANNASYSVRVSNPAGGVDSDPATLTVVTSGLLAQWDFNETDNAVSPPPPKGVGEASLVNTVNGFIPPNTPGTPYDTPPLGVTNRYWGSSTYPPQGTSNKTAGVQFKVSTVGVKNVEFSTFTRLTATSSRYSRLQYTTNGVDYLDFPVSSTNTTAASQWDFPPRTWNLAGFPGVANNPDFGVRIVTEFESTASYGQSVDANYVGVSAAYAPGGTYGYDLVTFTGDSISGAFAPPTISEISDRTVSAADNTVVNFTVTGNGPFTVSASSSNETAVAQWQLTPGITGDNGTLAIAAGFFGFGVAPIRVMATDADGNVTATWFYLTVTAYNAPPTISSIPHTNTLVNTPVTLEFTVGDDGPVGDLMVTAESTNPALLPNSNVVLGGSGANRTLTLTPVAGATGVAPVEVTVTDGAFQTTTRRFTLMVRPSTGVVFNDFFTYPNGPLVVNSFGLWATHSGTANQVDVQDGWINITQNESEDVNAKLIGEPYEVASTAQLYSRFTLNYTELPILTGTYFAHFKDDGTFNFRARVWGVTNGAAPGKYRVGIGNTSGTAPGEIFPMDLEPGVDYTVVTRIVVATGLSTLWINPSSEASPSVTDNAPVSPVALTSYAFRQAANEGTLKLGDLIVGLSFADVVDVLQITGITLSGSSVIIQFDGDPGDTPAQYQLLGAATADGTYAPVAATITSLGAGKFQAVTSVSGPTHFYQVLRQ